MSLSGSDVRSRAPGTKFEALMILREQPALVCYLDKPGVARVGRRGETKSNCDERSWGCKSFEFWGLRTRYTTFLGCLNA